MLSLVIETSTEKGCIALFDGKKELCRVLLPQGPQNAQAILPEIERLLHDQKVTLKDLTFMTVGNGPGSYTGMRVGAMAAKTLSYALKIPLIGESSLKAYVPAESGRFAAIIDAKIGGAYYLVGELKDSGVLWEGEPALAELGDLKEKLNAIENLVTPRAYPLRDKFELGSVKKWTWQETDPNPIHLTLSALEKYDRGEFTTDGQLPLLYLRKTQAEIERNA